MPSRTCADWATRSPPTLSPTTRSRASGPRQGKCSVGPREECLVPNSCKLSTDELKGEEVIMHTCVRCPNKYPWLDDPTGDGIILTGN